MSKAGENCLTDALLMRAIDGELLPPETWRVKLHLESCETCQARLDELQLVSSRVTDLHRVALPPDAPSLFAARLEEEESRERHSAWRQWFARPRPLWQKVAWCGALVVVLLVGLRLWTAHPCSTVRQIVHSLPPAVAPPHLVAEIPARPVRRTRHIVKKHAPREEVFSPARAALREVETPFFNLPFSDAALPLDQATVIRVELPRSALELAGLPVDEDRRNQRIQADLVLGADGLARAIRFVE